MKDLERRLKSTATLTPNNLIATITAFTAAVVAQDLEQLFKRKSIKPIELIVAGGGNRNPILMRELQQRCIGIRVGTIEEKGIPTEAREALGFALLAWWHQCKYPGNAPAITGARSSAILGMRADPP